MVVLQSVKGYKLFYCRANDAGRRLDRVVKKMLPDVPAGLIYSGIRKGLIKINDKKSTQSYRIAENDVIAVRESIHSDGKTNVQPITDIRATASLEKLTVLRTANLIFLNKPAGMLTHGPDSLAELLAEGLSGVEESLSFTPAPLHRLDRNTSGLITASLTIIGASGFSALMQNRQIDKYYIGLCINGPLQKVRLEDELIRKNKKTIVQSSGENEQIKAVTTADPILKKDNFTLCLFQIETGLTHQIRSQAAAAGFPLAGDNKYGGKATGFRNFILHSYALTLHDSDNVFGVKHVTANLPVKSMEKINSIFGYQAVSDTMDHVNTIIFH